MRRLLVAHSRVHDGSMLNRENLADKQVIDNRRIWLASLGIDSTRTYRARLEFTGDDFCRYREVSVDDVPVSQDDTNNQGADALITTETNQTLLLPIADCIGAVLFDEEHGVLMLSHLGRHSLEQHGGVRSVQYLVEHYGTNPKKLKIWLSAAISKELYKIYKLDNKGMKETLYQQLAEAGVASSNIEDTAHDTGTHPDYYSYSEFLKGRKPENGRHAVVAMMTDEPV